MRASEFSWKMVATAAFFGVPIFIVLRKGAVEQPLEDILGLVFLICLGLGAFFVVFALLAHIWEFKPEPPPRDEEDN